MVTACSKRTFTEGFPILPRFVLIRITPFAPRTPYTALADASFSMENDSISAGSILFRSRSMPSTRTKGLLLPLKDEIPRIKKVELSYPGSPVRCAPMTPASCPIKLVLMERLVPTCNFLGSIVVTAPTTETFFCLPKPTTTTSSNVFASSFSATLTFN